MSEKKCGQPQRSETEGKIGYWRTSASGLIRSWANHPRQEKARTKLERPPGVAAVSGAYRAESNLQAPKQTQARERHQRVRRQAIGCRLQALCYQY
jgi:hypothetical protein